MEGTSQRKGTGQPVDFFFSFSFLFFFFLYLFVLKSFSFSFSCGTFKINGGNFFCKIRNIFSFSKNGRNYTKEYKLKVKNKYTLIIFSELL